MKANFVVFVVVLAAASASIVRGQTISKHRQQQQPQVSDKVCPPQCTCTWSTQGSLVGLNCTASASEATDDWTSCLDLSGLQNLAELTSLSLVGCSRLTNLTRRSNQPLTSSSIVDLKLSGGSLRFLEAGALPTTLEVLDLAHNKISSLPEAFFEALSNLRFLDLSGNLFVTFDLSSLNPGLIEVRFDASPALEELSLSKQSYYLRLAAISAKNNLFLKSFCPWIIWRSPSLKSLDLSESPRIELPHRVFKANGGKGNHKCLVVS